MTMLTRADVVATVGPVDDHIIAEVLATGASAEELAVARDWTLNDDARMNAGRELPSGRVAQLVELIEAAEECLPGDPDEPA